MGKSQGILPSGAQRSFWGDAFPASTSPIKHIQEPSKAMLPLLLHASLCVLCLGHSTCVWTGGQLTQSPSPVHRRDARTEHQPSGLAARAFTHGAILLAQDGPTFLKTITVTGREAEKGPPAWVRLDYASITSTRSLKKQIHSKEFLKLERGLLSFSFTYIFYFRASPSFYSPHPLYSAMYGPKT